MIEPLPLQQVDRTYVLFRRRKLSYFSGCDYFRLASDPGVLNGLREGMEKFGLNVAASRLTTGNHALYVQLERTVADFFAAQAATLVPTGYLANLVAGQALAGNFSHALVDERAHAALVDAARLLECPVLRFKHRDPADAKRTSRRCGPGTRQVLLTDGLFAHDGSVAPLREYLKVLPKDAIILVDDAHGAGVLGRNGRGTPEHTGVPRKRVIQTVTLSKAFGVYGGVILGSASLRHRILDRSHLFIGSTPPPLPLANAALEAIHIFSAHKTRLRKRLTEKSEFVKNALRSAGCSLPNHPGPIVALVPKTAASAARLRATLLNNKIYPPFVQYPGAPAQGFFRFVISSEHTAAQLRSLVNALLHWSGLASVVP